MSAIAPLLVELFFNFGLVEYTVEWTKLIYRDKASCKFKSGYRSLILVVDEMNFAARESNFR